MTHLCLIAIILIANITVLPTSFKGVKANKIEGTEHLARFADVYDQATDSTTVRQVRILHIGDSHVKGNVFPRTVGEILGATMMPVEDGTRVVMDYIGINGAMASRFTDSGIQKRIADYSPHLVIISFGTNEAHGKYNAAYHTDVLKSLTDSIRANTPGVDILLTTPPGSYLSVRGKKKWKDKRGRWHYNRVHTPNHRTHLVAANIAKFARDNGIALWDIFEIAGGEKWAQANWSASGMMRKDRIHYTPEGYKLHGQLLGEALLEAIKELCQPHNPKP